MEKLNLENAARLVDKSAVTLKMWVDKQGCPVIQKGDRGRNWQFDKEALLIWYSQNKSKKTDTESFDDAKTRKMIAEATLAEINVEREKGRLVEVESVADIVADEYANVRARLLNLPQKVAPTVMGIQTLEEIQTILEDGVNEVLAELRYDVSD